jgi:hypothetical protein
MTRAALLVALGVVALAAQGCREQGPDPLACDRGYGFGYYGCADVTGTVLNGSNQPVASATIAAGGSTDPYDHVSLSADSTGKFAIRLMRRWVQQHPDMDTVNTWFHVTAPVNDSTLVQVRFWPVNQRPVPSAVVLHVP